MQQNTITNLCFSCKTSTQKQQQMHCSLCNHYYHLKCFNNNSNIQSTKNNLTCFHCNTIFPFQNLDTNEFLHLFQVNASQCNDLYNINKLNQLFSDSLQSSSNSFDSLSVIENKTYLTSETAASLLETFSEISFSSLCINIRSLMNPKNFAKFESLISVLQFKPHIIAINEIWEKPNTSGQHQTLDNYIYFSNPRQQNKGGGVAMYIKKNLIFDFCPDLCIMEEKIFESFFIDIHLENKTVTCGTIYRSPNKKVESITKFFNFLQQVLKQIKKKKYVYIMGDLNFDLLDQTDPGTEALTDIMFNNMFYPLINCPTRISDTSATTLDHIWTNITCTNIKSGILAHNISDHLPVIQVSELGKVKTITPMNNLCFSPSNLSHFRSSLETADFNNVVTCSDLDSAYHNFQNTILHNFNKHFFKQSTPHKKNHNWFDKELWNLLHKKDRLYKVFLQKNCSQAKQKYLKVKNKYFYLINKKKKDYYQKRFTKYQSNLKKIWQTINEILGRTKHKTLKTYTIIRNDKVMHEPFEIANAFNEHFSNISSTLTSQLPTATTTSQDYLTSPITSTMFFFPTSPKEIKLTISSLKSKLSAGWDGLPSIVIKCLPDNVIAILCYIFNVSLSEGKFIASFKHSKVIPLFKKGNPKDVANYRPISLLSCISKILEKLVYTRLYSFLKKFNIISNSQFGFRKGHSTSHLTSLLTDQLASSFNNKMPSLGVFLDLSKAFDTINHEILLKKLSYYGIRGTVHNWFKSYLTGRTQQVKFNATTSNIKPITSSVPQGSNLGPLLFIVYVNDFPNCLAFGNSLSFADDTTIILKDKCINKLFENTNKELQNIDNWLIANKLSINITKTKYILFSHKHSKKSLDKSLSIRNKKIERVASIKILGLVFNENLSWKNHMTMLINKLKSSLFSVMRIKPLLSTGALITLFHSLILSHIRYCITTWCYGNSILIKKLQKICDKFFHMISLSSHSIKNQKRNRPILSIYQMYNFNIALFMYKYFNKQLPAAFDHVFQTKSSTMSTRSNSRIIPISCRSTVYQQSIKYIGPKIWNKLPLEIRKSKSVGAFIKKAKIFYLKQKTEELRH